MTTGQTAEIVSNPYEQNLVKPIVKFIMFGNAEKSHLRVMNIEGITVVVHENVGPSSVCTRPHNPGRNIMELL